MKAIKGNRDWEGTTAAGWATKGSVSPPRRANQNTKRTKENERIEMLDTATFGPYHPPEDNERI